jgi:hypothetical protein
MDLVKVSGAVGARPTVSLPTPFHTTQTQFRTVRAGTGDVPIVSDAQLLVVDISLVDGASGRPIAATSYNGDLSAVAPLSQWTHPLPGLRKALQCATSGARIAVALAPSGLQKGALASLGLPESDALVAVVDVHKVYLTAANGSLVYNQGWGLPDVVRAPNGRPGIIVPEGAAPQNLTVQVLKRGRDAVVHSTDAVRVQELVVNWSDSTVASTTWDSTPISLPLSSQPRGIQDALKGQTVGSQIMAIVPPADGAEGAKDTQIFVFDILGIDAPAASGSAGP